VPPLTLIDTRAAAWPAESVLFGDDIVLIEETVPAAGRWFTLAGPDGEISLPAACWRRIAAAMNLTS